MSTSRDEAVKLLPALKLELKEAADGASDEKLLKFLLWKQNVQRAAERFRQLQKWRNDNSFTQNLKLSQDEKLKKHVASNVIINDESMISKDGCTVLVGRLRNNDMTDGRTPEDVCRMMLYVIDRALELKSSEDNGVIVFHDLKDISKNNLHPGIAKFVLKGIIGHFPLKIKGIYILNAPFFFKSFFAVVSLLLPKKLKQRMHYVEKIEDMYEVIDQELLLVEHGGKSTFDTEAWMAKQIERETSGEQTTILS